MAFPGAPDPHALPLNVLFPEHYKASKRTIAVDFVFFGSVIVGAIILGALLNLAATP